MYNPGYLPRPRYEIQKDPERNFVAAFFHMTTIALTCTSLAQLGWFRIHSDQCVPHLAVYQFFGYGYYDVTSDTSTLHFYIPTPSTMQYYSSSGPLQCVTPQISKLMRILILLCFLAMICSLIGFFLDIIGPTKKILRKIQKNAIPSTLAVLWVIIIIGLCYYISICLEEDLQEMFPVSDIQISFEYGYYTITAAGVAALIATACILLHPTNSSEDIQRRHLITDWDGVGTFTIGSTTPMENIPPPPFPPPPPPYTP